MTKTITLAWTGAGTLNLDQLVDYQSGLAKTKEKEEMMSAKSAGQSKR